MTQTSLNRDLNYVAVAGGVLDDGSGTIAPLSIQASTGRLKVTAIGITVGAAFPQLNQTQINALSPINGQTVYNTTTDVPQIYVAGAWYFLQLAQ